MTLKRDHGRFTKGSHWRLAKPWWKKEWLHHQYVTLCRSARSIAEEGGVTENAILYWLAKHSIPRRSMAETRALKHWGACGASNPMWNRTGDRNPNWKGGVTPERQAFYMSAEWRAVCVMVWKREKARCRRCGLRRDDARCLPLHVHHVVSFANRELRAQADNLVLLCETCHRHVHSTNNKAHEYISD